MAWTTPLDWTGISDGIVTAAQLNEQVRENLNVLSTHAHTGAAGQGASSMSGLTLAALGTLTFADQETDPDAAGELQRNGNDLLFYGASAVNLTAADQAAGTASLRSLGTTSAKAAAGDHTHTISSTDQDSSEGTSAVFNDNVENILIIYPGLTPAEATRAWVVYGSLRESAATGNTYTFKLKYDATILHTRASIGGGTQNNLLEGFQGAPSYAAHSISITAERTAGGTAYSFNCNLGRREVDI